jgi:hypothetical protein
VVDNNKGDEINKHEFKKAAEEHVYCAVVAVLALEAGIVIIHMIVPVVIMLVTGG